MGATLNGKKTDFAIRLSGIKPGALRVWNKLNPDWSVHEGDLVIAVNGTRGTCQAMAKAILSSDQLGLTIQRGRANLSTVSSQSPKDVLRDVMDEEFFQYVGDKLAIELREELQGGSIVLQGFTFTLIGYLILGVESEAFHTSLEMLQKLSGRMTEISVAELMWAFAEFGFKDETVLERVSKRAMEILSQDSFRWMFRAADVNAEDNAEASYTKFLAILYHATLKLAFRQREKLVAAIGAAAERKGMTLEEIAKLDGTPALFSSQ